MKKRSTIMKPRKQLIDAAVANGSIDRMNMLLSAAHLLNCEANSLVEEASDLMAENGLLLGNLKKLHNDFVRVRHPCNHRYRQDGYVFRFGRIQQCFQRMGKSS